MDNLLLGRRPPLIREAAAMIFGIVFVLSETYPVLEFVFALIVTPLMFGGMIRLFVIIYRIFILFLHSPLLCAILSLIGFGLVLTIVGELLGSSMVLGIIVLSALVITEAWFFIRDVRNAIFVYREKIAN